MDLNFLENSSLHFIDESNAIFVTRTSKGKRSIIIEIENEIHLAASFPPTPLSYFENRYPDKILIKNSQFSEEIKITLSIILRDNSINFSSDLTKYELLPEIKNWINDGVFCPEIYFFIMIITSQFPRKRQQMLHMLVKLQSEISQQLIQLLYHIRIENQIAIFREFGRWVKESEFLLQEADKLLDRDDKLGWYAHFYKMMFREDFISKFVLDLRHNAIQLFNNSNKSNYSKIKLALKNSPKTAYDGLIYPSILGDVPSKILEYVVGNKLSKIEFRTILMNLVRYAEMLDNPVLMGILMVLATSNREVTISKYEQTLTIPTLDRKLVYVRNRINSLLKIRMNSGKKESILKSLEFYLLNFPPEKANYRKARYRYLDVSKWKENHLIIQQFEVELMVLLHNKNILLKQMLSRLAFKENLMLFTWLLSSIEEDLIRSTISSLSFDEKLKLYTSRYYYPPGYNLFYLIRKGRKEVSVMISDFIPNDNKIKKTLNFFYRLRFSLTPEVSSFLLQFMHKERFRELNMDKLMQKYLNKVVRKSGRKYGDTLGLDTLNSIIENQHTNCQNCLRILNFIINWKSLCGFIPPPEWEDLVNGIKLANSEILDKIGIDAITPISTITLVTSYKIMKGEIHNIIEENAKFAINKYNWDQLAKHYLAIGLERPSRESLISSDIRKIPKILLRDQLGRIALVTETFSYCMENGFTPALERVLISNLYLRGWNIDAKIQNRVVQILGSVGHRLRSYLAAYLVIERSEVSDEILLLARDVDKKMIRDRLMRALERFGSANMWLLLAGSTYNDLSESAVDQIRRMRMAKDERVILVQRLLNSEKKSLRVLSSEWLLAMDYLEEETVHIFTSIYKDTWEAIIEYYIKFKDRLLKRDPNSYKIFSSMYWDPKLSKSLYNNLIKLAKEVPQLRESIAPLHESGIKSRSELVILAHEEQEED